MSGVTDSRLGARPLSSLLAFLTLFITLAGCGQSVTVPVTRMPPALPAVEPEQPGPVPTAQAPAPAGRLIFGGGRPLHGAPPYEAQLSATFSGAPETRCARLVWLFGDGTQTDKPCATDSQAVSTWRVSHRYEQPGTYHARVRLELADGTTVDSEKSQTVIIATPQGPRCGRPLSAGSDTSSCSRLSGCADCAASCTGGAGCWRRTPHPLPHQLRAALLLRA